jgi:hypothetical protein
MLLVSASSGELAFIAGVSANNTQPPNVDCAPAGNNPASFNGGYTNSMKWGGTSAGATAGTTDATISIEASTCASRSVGE